MWFKLDHVLNTYAQDNTRFTFCRGCSKFLYYGNMCTKLCLILCTKCLDDHTQVLATIFTAKLIKNPISCYFDDCKTDIKYSYFSGLDIKICINCYWNLSSRFHFIDLRNCIWIYPKIYKPFLLNISDINRTHPLVVISDVQMGAWADLIHNLVSVDINFGSIKQWACFTKHETLPQCTPMISSCLLIDCGKHKGRIASVVTWETQDTYLTRVDIVYDCIDDYVADSNIWLNKKRDINAINEIYDNISDNIYTHYADEIAILCHSFSGYIRCKKVGLPYI